VGPGHKYEDPIDVIVSNYMVGELTSASSDKDIEFIMDKSKSLEQRWSVLEKAWKRTEHTGYAQNIKRALKEFYDIECLTLQTLKSMSDRLINLEDENIFESLLEKAKITVRLEDMCWMDYNAVKEIVKGTYKLSPKGRLVISLPMYHKICKYEEVWGIGSIMDTNITSLDEYLNVCWEIFKAQKEFGCVAFKDQSAYTRTLAYANPPRSDAEEIFNWFMADPRRIVGYPDQLKPLDDFLFNQFMRMARDLELPVQIHTGHMAGVRNDIVKTNAVNMTPIFELHRDVKFDLFHANWPYNAELLYLAKNFPNVTIDFCWANIIDPLYCQDLFKRILSAVPHAKVHGYGSDFGGCADLAWAHAAMARDNIAVALADMIDLDYISLDDAKEVAKGWLFDNPNEFFKLGIKEF
jgi:hypothetical protein